MSRLNPIIIIKLNDKFQNNLRLRHNKYLFEDINKFITKIIKKILNLKSKSNFYYYSNGVLTNISLEELHELEPGEYRFYTNLPDEFFGLKKIKLSDFIVDFNDIDMVINVT
jgi:hypothetical protein